MPRGHHATVGGKSAHRFTFGFGGAMSVHSRVPSVTVLIARCSHIDAFKQSRQSRRNPVRQSEIRSSAVVINISLTLQSHSLSPRSDHQQIFTNSPCSSFPGQSSRSLLESGGMISMQIRKCRRKHWNLILRPLLVPASASVSEFVGHRGFGGQPGSPG